MAWGFFASKGFRLVIVVGSSETESAPDRDHLAILLRVNRGSGETQSAPDGDHLAILLRVNRGSGEMQSAPDGDCPATLLGVSRGSGAACPGRDRPDIIFQGAPFEATRVGSRNDCAVVSRPDATFHLRN